MRRFTQCTEQLFRAEPQNVILGAMLGPEIVVRSLSVPTIADDYGNVWQYFPQSDRHSKVACWTILFDLLQRCPLLRRHIAEEKVGFGINHTMIDFTADRQKDLDLVLTIPRAETPGAPVGRIFADLADRYAIVLTDAEREVLRGLPELRERPVGEVLVALEAKATMGAHVRAGPRLFDELTSAGQCINGSAPHAIAIGFGMVNASVEFVSPGMNKGPLAGRVSVVSRERQPNGVERTIGRFRSLRVRGHATERGYDAIGVMTIVARNDGTPITLAPIPPALPPGDSLHYETMVLRASGLYDSRFLTR
ncbi:MAG TPA: hypothetical protein VMM18_17245 [Gemmatimonadaceae bacterium]|nr:hypothetical protein [Gemmatimonadaceae bacterium]